MRTKSKVWEEYVTIPTYVIGEPDKNPMFFEKRVYQGASGKVYPYPVIDKIYDEKRDKKYLSVFLENEYIKIQILPELGGRIYRAVDKTNGYDFVYYNEVIKPALVGLLGPWISGGIEFNWPQHHRPTTFMPVDYTTAVYENGAACVRMYDHDRICGTDSITNITLYPERAYIEIHAELYNPTNLPQSFLWWANPAVAVNDNTQSIFPPDVYAVFDHGKRAVSKFPIATGVYYKHDYSSGIDISRYKNLPVPTSYMVYKSNFDFVGGYDYGKMAGILHVADHHISPGKKQWTWGCGDFGKAWDRNLTDKNGPYIELMTGVYTDNQPDFTWLMPYENKQFIQYFMPYKKLGAVKNATKDILISFNQNTDGTIISIGVYTTRLFQDCKVILFSQKRTYLKKNADIGPSDVLIVDVLIDCSLFDLTLEIYDSAGELLISYSEKKPEIEKLPDPAMAALPPEKIMTNEQLLLTGMHIEQYHHATYLPDSYYLEGLKRDPCDYRINNAYGKLLLRRGLFRRAEKYFRAAIARLTEMQPNPYDGEPYLNAGYSLLYQGQIKESYDMFFKATWTESQSGAAYYNMAAIACSRKKYSIALEYVNRALDYNTWNRKARDLKLLLLYRTAETGDNKIHPDIFAEESLRIDPFDYFSAFLLIFNGNQLSFDIGHRINGRQNSYLETAFDFYRYGAVEYALRVLEESGMQSSMFEYYKGFFAREYGKNPEQYYVSAKKSSIVYEFCNTLEDQLVLEAALRYDPEDGTALYMLGNLCYDKRRYEEAYTLWLSSSKLKPEFPTVHRNLALVLYNKQGKKEQAKNEMEIAFSLDRSDARIFMELDQLYKKIGISVKNRIENYEKYSNLFLQRDDLCTEYVTLLNLMGRHQEAYDFMMSRRFHPWEGGEGRITTQYVKALRELAKNKMTMGDYTSAVDLLEKSLVFPHNLGEGKLEGEKDNDIHYLLGLCYEKLKKTNVAEEEFILAGSGPEDPAETMYYNDQPSEMILYEGLAGYKTGNIQSAKSKFNKLIDYGEKHLFDTVSIDYFAVSLPDLQLFDEDLNIKNKSHCYFLMALGHFGLRQLDLAKQEFKKTLEVDKTNLEAILLLRSLEVLG